MARSCLIDKRTHPCSIFNSVCWEIENNRKPVLQNVHNMRPHRTAKARRKTAVVVNRMQIIEKQIRRPMILANQQGRRARRQATCKRPISLRQSSRREGTRSSREPVHVPRLCGR